jgi:hypothetical protein
MRHVQITAGMMILAGLLLGALISPGVYALSGFICAGRAMASATGQGWQRP